MILNFAALRNTQPKYWAKVDWSNPLTRGLVFAGYPMGNRFFDAITQQLSSAATAVPVDRNSIDGNKAYTREARGSLMSFTAMTTGFDTVVGNFSIFTEGSIVTNNTASLVGDSFSATTGNGFGLKFDDNNLITNGFFLFINNNNSSASNADVLGTNSETFKHRVMITGDGTNVKLYAKNKLDVTAANTTLPATATNRQTRILSSTNGANGCFLVFNRALSFDEYQSLYFNPWQVFQQPGRRRYFVVGATNQALGGSFISTDDLSNAGIVARGVVALAGILSRTDEANAAGVVAYSTPLSGSTNLTDEAARAGVMLVAPPPIQGVFIATDAVVNPGTVAPGARNLPGANVLTDEKTNVAVISSLPYLALWTSPASTNLGSVKPATAPLGTGTYTAVMIAWGTGAFGGGYFMIAANGGHTDYAGNEVYGLPISSYVPVLLRNTCSNTIIAGSTTIESSGLYATAATGNTPDPQQPRSRHGYDMSQWSSVKSKLALIGAAGMYIGAAGDSTVRYYDPVANTWETGPTILTPFDGPYSATCEDSSGNIWFGGVGTGARLNKIVPSTGVVTEYGDIFMNPLQSYYRTGIYDPIQNFFWVFGGNGAGSMQIGYWDLNNTSGRIDFTNITPTGATTILGQPAPGVAWYAADSKFVLWSGGANVAVFDPVTFKATAVNLHPSNTVTPSAAQGNGTFGRFRAIDPDTFLGVNSMDENFFKLQLRGSDKALAGVFSSLDAVVNPGTMAMGAVNLPGSNSKTDEANAAGTVANFSASSNLAGQAVTTDEKNAAGTMAAVFAIPGQAISTDEKTNSGSTATGTLNLPGQAVRTDESNPAGTAGLGALNLVGQAAPTDERANTGTTATVFALPGQFITTDERASAGTAAPAAVNLPGAAAVTDERLSPGTAAPGALNLPGANSSTDERANAGTGGAVLAMSGSPTVTDERAAAGVLGVAARALQGSPNSPDEASSPGQISLGGQALTGPFSITDERTSPGSAAPATVNIPGAAIGTDERTFPGICGTIFALAGAPISTDEAARAGTGGSIFALSGFYLTTDERLFLSTLATATVSLAGSLSRTDEQMANGLVNVNGQFLSGAFVATDEQARTGAVGMAPITLSGVFSRTDEAAAAGVMGLLYALQGVKCLTDEQMRTGLAAITAANLGGRFTSTDENSPGGVVGGLVALLGASMRSDESSLPGLVDGATHLAGIKIKTDERLNTSIFTVGGVTLIGQYTKTDEITRLGLIINGTYNPIPIPTLRASDFFLMLAQAGTDYFVTQVKSNDYFQ